MFPLTHLLNTLLLQYACEKTLVVSQTGGAGGAGDPGDAGGAGSASSAGRPAHPHAGPPAHCTIPPLPLRQGEVRGWKLRVRASFAISDPPV